MMATPQPAREDDPVTLAGVTVPDAIVPEKSATEPFPIESDYPALAERIAVAMRNGRRLIVVVGDPPPSPHTLSASLERVLADQHPVIVLSCGLLRGDALLDVCRGLAAHAGVAEDQPLEPPAPLFIFDEAHRLSDGQIKSILVTLRSIDHWTVVMLARPDFLTRLEHPDMSIGRNELTTRLRFREAEDPDATAAALPPRGAASNALLSAEAPDAAADAPPLPSPSDKNSPSADLNALVDLLERKLSGKPARPADPPPSSLFEKLTRDRPGRPSLAARLATPETEADQPDAAAAVDDTLAMAPADDAAAPAGEPPVSAQSAPRRVARALRLVIAAVFLLAAVGLAGAVWLHLGWESSPANPAIEGAAAPTQPAMSPAATAPIAAPSPTVAPKPAAAPPSTPAAPPAPSPLVEPAAAVVPASAPTPPGSAAPNEPAQVAPRPVLAMPAPPAPPPPPAQRGATAVETAPLVTRGDEFFATGDVVSARLFYERAADAGDAQAALRLGESFDPGFLDQAHVRGAKGDPAAAVSWYRRARELGSTEAEIVLQSLEGK